MNQLDGVLKIIFGELSLILIFPGRGDPGLLGDRHPDHLHGLPGLPGPHPQPQGHQRRLQGAEERGRLGHGIKRGGIGSSAFRELIAIFH